MNKVRVKRLELDKSARILVVSDIHTADYLLSALLEKVNYKPNDDYLFIVGDILEHWDNNISTIHTVMKLCENKRVYCVMGNNDVPILHMAYEYEEERFINEFKNKNFSYVQMAESLGFKECTKDNWHEIREKVNKEYKKELNFINDFYLMIETDDFVFVHAGLENRADYQNTSEEYALTCSWFFNRENPTDKWLVFGHYPSYNYKKDKPTNLPLIDYKRKMIDIDGGLTIKWAGQVNLLIIKYENDEYKFSCEWESVFEKRKAIKEYKSNLKPVYINYENNDYTLIKKENGLVLLRDNKSKQEGYIPENEVYYEKSKPLVYQWLSSFPSIKKGEEFFYVGEQNGYALIITNDGIVGWVPKDCVE